MGSEFLAPVWGAIRYSSHTEMGSEFLTLDNSEELSVIVFAPKWVQNFWPLIIQRNCPLLSACIEMGSEFLTPDHSEELFIYSAHKVMGSEFLTLDNSEELSVILCLHRNGFRISDPWLFRGIVLYWVPVQKWVQNFWPLIVQRSYSL